ncbi:MAG: glycosyltransferase [Bacillota bacterium]
MRELSIPAGEHPLITVLMPTYNQASFLSESIESVIAQTYPHWELVVVDDGSTDDTPDALARFAARDPRVKPSRQPNGGVAQALNAGLGRAAGDYVCWLSSDDLWVPEKLERQLAVFTRDPDLALVYSEYEIIDEHGQFLRSMPGLQFHGDEALVQLIRQNHINGCTVMIPRRVFSEVGPFDPDLKYAQDYDMWLRIAAGRRIRLAPGSLVKMRVHAGQMSQDNRNEDDALRALRKNLPAWTPEVLTGGEVLSPGRRAMALARLAMALRTRPGLELADEARRLFSEAVEAAPPAQVEAIRASWVKALAGLAAYRYAQSRAGEAESILREALKDASRDGVYARESSSPAWFNLGVIQLKGERYREAVESFEQAVKCDPANAESAYHLAYACTCAGDPHRGEEQLRRTLHLKADHRLAREGLAMVSAALEKAAAGQASVSKARLNFHVGEETDPGLEADVLEVARELAKRGHKATVLYAPGRPLPDRVNQSSQLVILPEGEPWPVATADVYAGRAPGGPGWVRFDRAWVSNPTAVAHLARAQRKRVARAG